MPTKTVLVPPSSTTTTVVFEYNINPATVEIADPVMTGGTPIEPPPVTDKPPAEGYKEVYRLDFSKAIDIDPDGNGQKGNGYIANGAFVSRPASVSAGIRSEVQLDSSRLPREGRIEYDVKYDYVVKDACHSLQFHPDTSGGSASPGLWHEAGRFVWKNWKNGTNTPYATGITIPTGLKMHFVIDYKFGSGGYLKHSIDGKVILDKTNIQVGDGTTPTLKLGFNGGFDKNTTEAMKSNIVYDNLVIYQKI